MFRRNMLAYIWQALLRRSSRNALFLVGLLALSSGLSTYVAASQGSTQEVKVTLDEHWRGAYDLLVRPADAVQPTELQYGLVESNYLSAGRSGIAVQQWKQIQHLPGVEIAAPVATIGYLRTAAASLVMDLPPQSEDSFYRVNVAISSTNGYRVTGVLNSNDYVIIRPTTGITSTEQTSAEVLLFTTNRVSAANTGEVYIGVRSLPVVWTLVAGIDPAAERALLGLDEAVVEGNYLSDNDGLTTQRVPDPSRTEYGRTEEELKRRSEDGRNFRINPDGPNIPIMFAASTYVSLPTTITVDKLVMLDDGTIERIRKESQQEAWDTYDPESEAKHILQTLQRKRLDALDQPVAQMLLQGGLDLGDLLRPMSIRPMRVSLFEGEAPLQTDLGAFTAGDLSGMEQTYRPGAIIYESFEAPFDSEEMLTLAAVPKLEAQTIITGTGEVAFRSLPLETPAMAPPPQPPSDNSYRSPFTFREVGSYDLGKLPDWVLNPDPLTYVPLGIYTPPLVKLVRDADGALLPEGPETLQPTLNPASFIPGPPLALTDIASARFFRGDRCIDAIRVKVADIDRYTPENVKKVEEIARHISETTGLHVDIVAGSSPQKVLVYIPGSPDDTIPPLGYVEEQWTTLGAAAAVQQGTDRASILMLGATGLAGLLYLISQSLLATLSRRKEIALLQAVGWRRRHVVTLMVGEAGLLGVLGGLCAGLLAVLIAGALGLVAPPEQVTQVAVAVVVLYVAASVGPALWAVRQPVAELLQRGEITLRMGTPSRGAATRGGKQVERTASVREARARGRSGAWALAVFAWRNLSHRRMRTVLAAGAVAVATGLLTLLVTALASLGGTLRVTLLGQFVGLQVQPYHYIMVGSAVVVSVLAVADHLAVGVLERRHELALLQAVGWRARAVRLSLLLEGLWLGLLGGLAGALGALLLVVAARSESITSAGWSALAGLALMLLLSGLSSLYAIFLTSRQTLSSAMHQ